MAEYSLNPKEKIAQIIRINHAGEYAAIRIYQGQLDYTKDPKVKKIIQEMADGEVEHLEYFEQQIQKRGSRPTILYPVVNCLGYALGAITAKMGTSAAMACTTAVEEVIADHYQGQLNELDDSESDLKASIKKFRDDEIGHKETAFENGAKSAPAYPALSGAIKFGCKLAIKLAKKF